MSQFVLDSGELSSTKQDAEAGSVGAQFRLALHFGGSGPWSVADEIKWMKAAADQNHQLAQFCYARLNLRRDGTPADMRPIAAAESLAIFNRLKSATITTEKLSSSSTQLDAANLEALAADVAVCLHRMGYARAALAQHQIVGARSRSSTIRGFALIDAAKLLLNGDGDLPIDERYAVQLLEDATKVLPSQAFLELGDLLLTGRDVYDPQRAMACYRSEMKRDGNETELLRLARMHAIGIGVAADKAAALALLQPLCDEDKAPAGELGMWAAYCGFISPGKAWKAHERVHELACNETHADAQYLWAMAHLHGLLDRKKDTRIAIEWFTKAAANGHVHAKAQLALIQPYSRVIRREGLLSKKGAIVPSWKQRHFILDQSLISYAETKEQKAIRSLPLAGMRIAVATPAECSKPFAFTLRHVLDTRSFLCVAGNVSERDEWMAAITAARDHATWGRGYPHDGSGPVAPFNVTAATELVDRTILQALTPSAAGGAATIAAATPSSVDIEVKGDNVARGSTNFNADTASTSSSGPVVPPTTPIDGVPNNHYRTATPAAMPVLSENASDSS